MNVLRRKARWPQLRFQSTGSRLAFFVALLAIGVAFWYNTGRQFQKIANRSSGVAAVHDAANALSPAQIAVLTEFQEQFYAVYGIRLHLALVSAGVSDYAPPSSGSAPFIAVVLSVEDKSLEFIMSPLVEVALGPDWLEDTSVTALRPLMQEGRWPEALNETLNALSGRLRQVLGKGTMEKSALPYTGPAGHYATNRPETRNYDTRHSPVS